MLLTVIGYKCHGRIMFLLKCIMCDNKKSKGANWKCEQYFKDFEHLFSIARRIGKVDDLVTDLDFRLPQIKQILWNLSFNIWVAMGIWRYVTKNQSKKCLS